MKFKMAPNSLFAVLLRSPWWISIGIAVVFVGAAQTLLPPDYRGPLSLGAFPFVAIGAVAFWRQLRAPSASESQSILDAVQRMNWASFRSALEQAYVRDGHAVERIEGAADLLLRKDGATTLVAAKRWKAAHQGEENLRALKATATQRDASRCVYVALGDLSPNARKVAQSHTIDILDGAGLVRLLRGLKLPA
jgi:restriction system protein